jgi:hypothetical protein
MQIHDCTGKRNEEKKLTNTTSSKKRVEKKLRRNVNKLKEEY